MWMRSWRRLDDVGLSGRVHVCGRGSDGRTDMCGRCAHVWSRHNGMWHACVCVWHARVCVAREFVVWEEKSGTCGCPRAWKARRPHHCPKRPSPATVLPRPATGTRSSHPNTSHSPQHSHPSRHWPTLASIQCIESSHSPARCHGRSPAAPASRYATLRLLRQHRPQDGGVLAHQLLQLPLVLAADGQRRSRAAGPRPASLAGGRA
jgi:hypothetical protein